MDWGGCVWETHGCGLWKSIIRMGLDKFLEYIHFDVGNGSWIRLWHDRWCGDQSLWVTFPTLCDCSLDKEELVGSMLVSQIVGGVGGGVCGGKRSWDVRFV